MSRIKDLQKQVHKILKDSMDDNQKRAAAVAHLHGVSLAAVMIAKKRGENPELAAMAGLLHDLYAYRSGSYDDHAHRGADYAREVLEELGITNKEETDIICSAIWHHDSKAEIDSPMDEPVEIEKLSLQESEVEEVRWFDLDELRQALLPFPD